jgi:hypothetical protein
LCCEQLETRLALSTITWTGANHAMDNNWSDGLNWSGGVAPGSGDIANFTSSGTQSFTANVDTAFTVAGVTIDGTWGGAINVNAALTVTGNLALASGSFGGPGGVSVGGTASTWTGGTLFPGAGGFTNKGTLSIDDSGGNLGLFTPVSGWLADGNANDSVGGNNGTLQGGATFATGITGQAFSFDGSSGSVVVPDSPSLDFTKQFTLSAWINPSANMQDPAQGGIVSKVGMNTGQSGYQFYVTGNNTKLGLQFNSPGQQWPGNQLVVTLNTAIPLNQWTYVDGTYDQSNLNIYVNGTLAGSQAIGPTTIATTAANFRISGDDNSNVHFAGLIDDVSVYNRALTPAEIQTIMNGTGAGTLTNNGTINLGGSNSLFLANGSSLNNAKGAKFNLTADDTISSFLSSAFTNAGTFGKIKGTGTSTIAPSTFSNTGTVNVNIGTMDITASVSQVSGSTLTAGTWTVSHTGTGSTTLDMTSAGTLTTIGSKATVTLSGPHSAFTNLSSLADILKGGSFSFLRGQSFTTIGDLINNGGLTLSSGSTLSVAGSFTQTSTATLTEQVKTTSSATTEGEIVTGANGTITLGGQLVLNVVGSSLSALNVPFTILDGGNSSDSISGTFTNLPEGSAIKVNGHLYKISYVGGDGNDVTLTRIS